MPAKKSPVVLMIWDGFGVRRQRRGNAIAQARMPAWQNLQRIFPQTLLSADGAAVGLAIGQTGNSEAGHATIGAGRPVLSDQLLIDRAIKNGSFADHPALKAAIQHCQTYHSRLHLMGLLTEEQSGHASARHVRALLAWIKRHPQLPVAMHVFTDGRDSAPTAGLGFIKKLQRQLPSNANIETVIGRFYAMDRNREWQRTSLAYEALTRSAGIVAASAAAAIEQAYRRGENDEYLLPTVIQTKQKPHHAIHDNDAVLFWNLRSDRARQLVKPFVMSDVEAHQKPLLIRHVVCQNLLFLTLTEFGKNLDHVIPVFPHHTVHDTLVEALKDRRQIYLAESEKFSQITYFFNGGHDQPRFGEHRLIVPSPHASHYDTVPDMSAEELTRRLIDSIAQRSYDFIAVNYANADMVAHSGNLPATIAACEALDRCLARVWPAIRSANGALLITSDHGNAETLRDKNGDIDTCHDPNPVPFLIANPNNKRRRLPSHGTLADIAPTILSILNIEQPPEMTGKSLLK